MRASERRKRRGRAKKRQEREARLYNTGGCYACGSYLGKEVDPEDGQMRCKECGA